MRLSDGTPQQPQLLRLLPHLILIWQRKLAVSAIVRPWASSFVRSLMSISDCPSSEILRQEAA